jgi:hypothetical protein
MRRVTSSCDILVGWYVSSAFFSGIATKSIYEWQVLRQELAALANARLEDRGDISWGMVHFQVQRAQDASNGGDGTSDYRETE